MSNSYPEKYAKDRKNSMIKAAISEPKDREKVIKAIIAKAITKKNILNR